MKTGSNIKSEVKRTSEIIGYFISRRNKPGNYKNSKILIPYSNMLTVIAIKKETESQTKENFIFIKNKSDKCKKSQIIAVYYIMRAKDKNRKSEIKGARIQNQLTGNSVSSNSGVAKGISENNLKINSKSVEYLNIKMYTHI